MSLMPSVFALFAALLFSFAASRSLQDNGLLMSQQTGRLLALQRAQVRLAQATDILAGATVDAQDDGWIGTVETLPSAADAELQGLPLMLQRVTVVGDGGAVQVRLQADFAVDGCDTALDGECVPRVRRIAWRQLPGD